MMGLFQNSIGSSSARRLSIFAAQGITLLCILLLCSPRLTAQSDVPQPAHTPPADGGESELTKGLLDELNEGESQKSDDNAGKQTGEKTSGDKPAANASGLRGDGPLDLIHMGMLAASSFLRKGQTGSTTQEIQKNVLLRLDDLILQTEQAEQKQQQSQSGAGIPQSRPQPQSDKDQQNQSQRNQQPSRQTPGSKDQNSQKNGQSKNDPEGDKQEEAGNTPGGEAGDPTKSKTELADPRSLQQGVWGHLPERIRQQMTSQMVERFLPKYEAAIRQYYERLAEEENE